PTEAFDSIVGRAMRDADSTLDTEARSGAAAFTRLRAGFLLLLVVIVAAAAAMSRVIIRGITGPVADAVVLAEKVAAGDLEATIVVDGTDEVGRLQSALDRMTTQLRDTISQVRAGADALSPAAGQVSA